MTEIATERRRSRGWGCLGALVGLLLIGGIAWKAYEGAFYRAQAPRNADLEGIAYIRGKAWGFGPGGNETGIVIFRLGVEGVEALRARPNEFLAQLAPPADRPNCPYASWQETPLFVEASADSIRPEAGPMTFARFADRYGFSIEISKRYENIVDRAFASSGSYFAERPCGGALFLFVPSARVAALMYAG